MRFPIVLALLVIAAIGYQSLRTRDGDAVRRAATAGTGSEESSESGRQQGPQRILPGSAAAADWLAALLERPDRVVALPSQVMKYSAIRLSPETWKEHARFDSFASENIMSYEPDLVLVSPFTDPAVVARVVQAGYKVLSVPEPTTWEGMLRVCKDIGTHIHRAEAAAELLASLEERRLALGARTPRRAIRVLPYTNYGGGGYTSGPGTTLDLALEMAGYKNVAASLGIEGSGSITNEMLLAAEIDAVLVSAEDGVSTARLAMRNDDVLSSLKAIDGDRFIYLDQALFASGSQTLLDAAEDIARQGDAMKFD